MLLTPDRDFVTLTPTEFTDAVELTPLNAIDTLGVTDPTDAVALTPEIDSD